MEQTWIEKLAIQELCARYAHAIDSLDPEAWVQCFTPDGGFQVATWVVRGHAALREVCARACAGNSLPAYDQQFTV